MWIEKDGELIDLCQVRKVKRAPFAGDSARVFFIFDLNHQEVWKFDSDEKAEKALGFIRKILNGVREFEGD